MREFKIGRKLLAVALLAAGFFAPKQMLAFFTAREEQRMKPFVKAITQSLNKIAVKNPSNTPIPRQGP